MMMISFNIPLHFNFMNTESIVYANTTLYAKIKLHYITNFLYNSRYVYSFRRHNHQ